MSEIQEFLRKNSSQTENQMSTEIVGIIKNKDMCLVSKNGRVVVDSCPPNLRDYKENYFFRYKNHQILTYDQKKCLRENNAKMSFIDKSEYEPGQYNCTEIIIGNGLRLETKNRCIVNNGSNCSTDSFRLSLDI